MLLLCFSIIFAEERMNLRCSSENSYSTTVSSVLVNGCSGIF